MPNPLVYLIRSYARDPGNWLRNISWRLPRTISDKRMVFVVGSPRSGTTLLQRICSVHEQLFSIEGETGLFSWQNIFRDRRHFGLPDEDLSQLFATSRDTVDFFSKAITILENKNHNAMFVEKTPQHVLRLSFLRKHFPNAKFVHIFRDGRDCYCSSLNYSEIPQRRSVEVFANYWKECVKAGRQEGVYQICYESLAKNAVSEVSALMSFLGLELQNSQLDPNSVANDHRGQLEQFSKLNDPINPSSCGRWRDELDAKQVAKFEQIAGDELQALGYRIGRSAFDDAGIKNA